jgi:hypothetical protein
VLAIGGLKEKLLAALRGGIKTVLIPEENRKDLAEIPANIREGLEIVPVSHVDEVLARALVARSSPSNGPRRTIWPPSPPRRSRRAGQREQPHTDRSGSPFRLSHAGMKHEKPHAQTLRAAFCMSANMPDSGHNLGSSRCFCL